MIAAIGQLADQGVTVSRASGALGLPRSTYYRGQRRPVSRAEPAVRPKPARALSDEERVAVRNLLNSDQFMDRSPRQVYAALLDDGKYYCSVSTMYRILAEHDEVRERRNQLRHPTYSKPELLATGPNDLWSWDITKLRGPSTGTYYYLYVILDVYSRYVVGWMIAERESAQLAEQLIAETCAKQGIDPWQLTIHADRGSPMIAKSVALLLADLGVNKSHARPHVPDDNPFSEAQFKTLKYRPDYPDRFGSLADARGWAQRFFAWYNNDHYHSGLGLLTPAVVHHGRAQAVRHARQQVLQQAYQTHPERFVKGVPTPAKLPAAVWINPPQDPSHSVDLSNSSTEHLLPSPVAVAEGSSALAYDRSVKGRFCRMAVCGQVAKPVHLDP